MLINNFSKYIFWSYKKDVDLPDELVIKQVAIYGKIKDLIILTKLYDKNYLLGSLQSVKKNYAKRFNFIRKVIL